MTPNSSAHLTCLCGAITEPGTILSDPEIPVHSEICHCYSCSRTTGSLAPSFPQLNSSPSKDTISKLTAYNSSETHIRYFCSKCGCHCFILNHQKHTQEEWFCLGGIIEQSPHSQASKAAWPQDVVRISQHIYVSDTIDGGLVPILLNLGGRTIPACPEASPESPEESSSNLSPTTVLSLPKKPFSTPKDGSHLAAICHCGGVSLLIKRADYTSELDRTARRKPSDPKKYLTWPCACRSCRLSTGVSLMPYALIPPHNIFTKDLTPITFGYETSNQNANPSQTLKHNWSSPDTCRSFCGKCGATVFYWCEKRPDEVDVSVGIMRAEEGSMARAWLEWVWGSCDSTEEAIDEETVEAWVGCADGKVMGGVEQ